MFNINGKNNTVNNHPFLPFLPPPPLAPPIIPPLSATSTGSLFTHPSQHHIPPMNATSSGSLFSHPPQHQQFFRPSTSSQSHHMNLPFFHPVQQWNVRPFQVPITKCATENTNTGPSQESSSAHISPLLPNLKPRKSKTLVNIQLAQPPNIFIQSVKQQIEKSAKSDMAKTPGISGNQVEERVNITEELHIDFDQSKETGEKTESPASKQSEASNENSSPESIQLISSDESDGENAEMGRNWRMLMLFNGRVDDKNLPFNCGRPQTDEGRTFPGIKRLGAGVAAMSPNPQEQIESEFTNGQQQQMMLMGQNSPNPMMGQGTSKDALSNIGMLSNSGGFGYVSRQGSKVWISNELAKRQNLTLLQTTPTTVFNPFTSSNPNEPQKQQTQQTTSTTRKRFSNKSLIIFKNGKRTCASAGECFQFLENGTCPYGVFCNFEHNGSTAHKDKKVCPRLMRGQCRHLLNDDTCPDGPHSTLLPHQLPVCDFYLRACCCMGKEDCQYLHIKHTDGEEPCQECPHPHRYLYHRVREKQMERQTQTTGQSGAEQQPAGPVTASQKTQKSNENPNKNKDILQWWE